MANYITSPNMNLSIPAVGIDPGPEWATDLNNSLNLIDQHNHTPGYGVQVPPAGLNINTDLTFQSNNATNLRSVRFSPQGSVLSGALDLGCLYEVTNDLYYNDGAGNNIRLTINGSIAGTTGSISGLVPPASASYSSFTDTFVFQSNTNTPANLDGASINLRNLVANSPALTLSPPTLSSSYTLTLPTIPGSTGLLTIDNTGVISSVTQIGNSFIAANAIATSNIQSQAITQGLLAPRATGSTVAAGGFATSASIAYTTPSGGTYYTVPNATVTITTTGRPVFIGFMQDPSNPTQQAVVQISNTANVGTGLLSFYNGSTQLTTYQLTLSTSASNELLSVPSSTFSYIDTPAAGTYTYTVQIKATAGSGSPLFSIQESVLIAYEL